MRTVIGALLEKVCFETFKTIGSYEMSNLTKKEHYCLLTDRFANDEKQKYSDILQQLRHVSFREKLWYVIRHYLKLDKEAQK